MKKIFAALALGAALTLPGIVSAEPNLENTNNASEDISLAGEFTNDEKPEISGTLFNTSDNTAYENVVIRVDFYDEDRNIIKSENYTLNEDVNEGEDEDFTLTLDNAPENMFHADFNVAEASLD